MGATVFGPLTHQVLRWAVACFLLAGACGGVIAANIAEFSDEPMAFFESGALMFWKKKGLTYSRLAAVEHAAFWIGILPLAATFLLYGGAGFKSH